MRNFSIHFSYPWLLLLLIPAVVLTLIPYFKLSKRYRKTRNRITSIVLHLCVMLFAICLLSGMQFLYQLPNEDNEIILLVDVSETQEAASEKRDDFIKVVLDESRFDGYKVGVVTFGFDQEYAVPLTNDVEDIYDSYKDARLPDTSATNIAAAIRYAKDLFENPQTGKIVLITDAKETDESATEAIRSVVAEGIKLDTAYISSSYDGGDMQIIDIVLPDYYVKPGDTCEIGVTVQSTEETSAKIELYDNGEMLSETDSQNVDVKIGTNTFSFTHTFMERSIGLHELRFKIVESDLLEENNAYTSYLYMQIFNKILIFEREEGTSNGIVDVLNGDSQQGEELYEITTVDISDLESLPATLQELCEYDQVIMNNVSNRDLPEGFDVILEQYVGECGGGLFTVGGDDEKQNANMYNQTYMRNTLYESLLPIQTTRYTPPVGVVIIIDRSGSMATTDMEGRSHLEWAKAAAMDSLHALTERDYVGIMTLDSAQEIVLRMTQRTREAEIRDAINNIGDATGGTIYSSAINRAGEMLRSIMMDGKVAKGHMLIISDAVPGDTPEVYEPFIEDYYNTDGITLSIAALGVAEGSDIALKMQTATDKGHGKLYCIAEGDELSKKIQEDLNAPTIEEVNEGDFNPIVHDILSPLLKNVVLGEGDNRNKMTTTLGGFYGVKVRSDAELILKGDYDVPLYAQWKYGNGMVGSFMCDLNYSAWSSDFMTDESARIFIRNVVDGLMPIADIKTKDIKVTLLEDNYTNQMSVITDLNIDEGEYIQAQLIKESAQELFDPLSLNKVTEGNKAQLREMSYYVTTALGEGNKYTRCSFVIKESGVYRIVVSKHKKDGTQIGDNVELYKEFSYSEEYDTYMDAVEIPSSEKLSQWAEKGNGQMIKDLEDPVEIFSTFVTAIDKSFDPRMLFMILSIVLFLLDIAVRKFKFKWPHEIIRDYKNKKSDKR